MEIYQKYPLSELIIHPRTQKDFYRGEPDQELFGKLQECIDRFPVCYNGNLLTAKDYRAFTERFPQVEAVMLGRGVIANPGLIRQIRTGEPTDKITLRAFHDEVLQGYREVFGEDKNALFRMKEMWIYMIHLFSGHEKYAKKIRKSQSLAEYGCAVDALFAEQELLPDGPLRWNLPQR
jgi:tRNA-dihydrouridine synthase